MRADCSTLLLVVVFCSSFDPAGGVLIVFCFIRIVERFVHVVSSLAEFVVKLIFIPATGESKSDRIDPEECSTNAKNVMIVFKFKQCIVICFGRTISCIRIII